MDEEEVSKQLDQMVKFIYREADEKAKEIQAKAREEASIEKNRIVSEEKAKIAKTFETKEKTIEVKKKIDYSNELNQSRLRVLKARDEGVQRLLSEAHKKLTTLTKNPDGYKKLLHSLIVQGLLKIVEPKVKIVIRKEDQSLVDSIKAAAVRDYTAKTGNPVELEIESSTFLPPSPENAKVEGDFW